jgi:hypothetical protein
VAHDPEGDAQRERCIELLNSAEPGSRRIAYWWRDDDAETATPALDRLLLLARRHDLPLALAVVPKRATADLADRLARSPNVSVLQHGWSHRNHAPAGEKKMELGDHRPLDAVLDDLKQGFDGLATLFPGKFLPVLVPPWNRIAVSVRAARGEIGLTGISTFGPVSGSDRHEANTHLDVFVWKPARRPLERAEAYAVLASELERRLAGDQEPIGILTHHLVHEEKSWDLLDELFGLIAKHPAVAWPKTRELFGLSMSG